MRTRFSLVMALSMALVAAFAATAGAQAAAAPPRNAWIQALTGSNANNTASIVYSGLGTAVVTGNKLQPVTRFRVAINYGMEMLAVEVDQPDKPHQLAQYYADRKAWDVVDKKLVLRSDAVAERMRLMFMTPHGVIKAAQDAGTKRIVAAETVNARLVTTLVFPVGDAWLKAYLDDKGMVTRVHTMSSPTSAGKSVVEFLYSDFRDYDTLTRPNGPPPGGAAMAMAYGGIPFPSRIVQKMDGVVVLDIGLTEVVLNQGVTVEVPPSVERAYVKKK